MNAEEKRAFNSACKLLAIRDRSVFEICSALAKKGYSEAVVQSVVEELKGRRLLNDVKFALAYAESLLRNKKAGPRYISAALQRKGLEKGLAEKTAGAVSAGVETQETAIEEWIKKKSAEKRKNKTPGAKKKRIFDFLLRRGFSPELVYKHIFRMQE
ncbi:MAG: regulatory protein RecX [Nitrospinae bacterium]|nr:regulatory protein RecX [Nitrospinota bacterium]